MSNSELKVASNVKFALVDLRFSKKPKLSEILKMHTNLPTLELDVNKRNNYALKDFVTVLAYHIVLVTT